MVTINAYIFAYCAGLVIMYAIACFWWSKAVLKNAEKGRYLEFDEHVVSFTFFLMSIFWPLVAAYILLRIIGGWLGIGRHKQGKNS